MQNKYRNMLLTFAVTDVGQNLRFAFEACGVFAIVMMLVTLAARNYETQISIAEISEAFTLVSTSKVDLIAHRAETGHWPSNNGMSGNGTLASGDKLGRYVSQLDINYGGAIDVTMGIDGVAEGIAGRRITFRFGLSDGHDGATIILACGNYPAPPGMTLAGRDRTTIDPDYLPSFCKEL